MVAETGAVAVPVNRAARLDDAVALDGMDRRTSPHQCFDKRAYPGGKLIADGKNRNRRKTNVLLIFIAYAASGKRVTLPGCKFRVRMTDLLHTTAAFLDHIPYPDFIRTGERQVPIFRAQEVGMHKEDEIDEQRKKCRQKTKPRWLRTKRGIA